MNEMKNIYLKFILAMMIWYDMEKNEIDSMTYDMRFLTGK